MIEWLWDLLQEFWVYLQDTYDPVRDTLDIGIVAFGTYWLLLLIRGTRAVQILVGLVVLIGALVASRVFELVTLQLILDALLAPGVIILVILFQHDIRRALARMGRGLFRGVSAEQESQIVEEIVRAAQTLSKRRIGGLVVLERETGLDDQLEASTPLDAAVAKDLLVSLFLPASPLHDGAVVVQRGRIAMAGAILPLTVRDDLPEGVGTRHRAAVGITEETDAVVVVVSEETGSISLVMGGEIVQGLDAPELRSALSDVLGSERRELSEESNDPPQNDVPVPDEGAEARTAS
ncbi:MAG: diadenylate cyclase CdaA [Myxococcota bacterium]|nr:diadenylate cyclase CdaA [Myxococcota bacterium]